MIKEDYTDELGIIHICTCTEECTYPCKGGCGCDACLTAYSDFLSGE